MNRRKFTLGTILCLSSETQHRIGVINNLARTSPEVSITIEGFAEDMIRKYYDQGGLCAVTGFVMTYKDKEVRPTQISIDRIDSAKGYTNENTRLVCLWVNNAMGVWGEHDLAKLIVSTHPRWNSIATTITLAETPQTVEPLEEGELVERPSYKRARRE